MQYLYRPNECQMTFQETGARQVYGSLEKRHFSAISSPPVWRISPSSGPHPSATEAAQTGPERSVRSTSASPAGRVRSIWCTIRHLLAVTSLV